MPCSLISKHSLHQRTLLSFWPEFKTLDELKEQYVKGGIGDGTCKEFLNSVINKMLDPIRARRHEFEQDIPEVFNTLEEVARMPASLQPRPWMRFARLCVSTISAMLPILRSRLRNLRFDADVKDRNIK